MPNDADREAVLFVVRAYLERAERSPGLSSSPFSVEGWRAIEVALRAAPPTTASAVSESGWIKCSDRLPDDETPVLVLFRNETRIGELRWERPSYEETWPAYRYWDDPINDGQDWDWPEITHWMPLPPSPSGVEEG